MLANTSANTFVNPIDGYDRRWAQERLSLIRQNPELWDWTTLSMNPNFNLEDIKTNMDLPWNWTGVLQNPNITFDDVMNNPDLPWDWDELCLMPSLCEDHLCDHPFLPWNSKYISSNHNISVDFLIDNVYVGDDPEDATGEDEAADEDYDEEADDEDYDDLANDDGRHYGSTPRYDIRYDAKHKHIKVYDWDLLSSNPSLRIDHVMNHLALPWNWEKVISNKSISLDDILNNLYDENNKPTPFEDFWYNITERVEDIEYPLTHMTDAHGNTHNWDWRTLSYNSFKLPSITVDILVQHKDLDWDWTGLAQNPNITFDDIVRTLPHNLPWDWAEVSLYKDFTIDQLIEHQDKLNWRTLSINKNITPEIIQATLQLNWDDSGRIRTWSIAQLLEELIKMRQNTEPRETMSNTFRRMTLDNELHARKELSIDVINNHPNYPWRWYSLSITMPLEDILNYPHLNWVWGYVSERSTITLDFILSNPQYPWNYENIAGNNRLTQQHINAHPEIIWEYGTGNLEYSHMLRKDTLSENEMYEAKTAFIKEQIQKRQTLLTLNSIQRQRSLNEDLAKLIADYL